VEVFAEYCTWLMSDIVPTCKQNKGVSIEASRRWLHQLGFDFSSTKTGYNDGLEKVEVKEYREQYLKIIMEYQSKSYLFDEKGEQIDTPSIKNFYTLFFSSVFKLVNIINITHIIIFWFNI